MSRFILIFLGSGAGGVCRYILSGWAQRLGRESFPLGTLTVNIVGCFAIGFLSVALSGRWMVREEHRIAVMVGVIGGFTTFSAFGMETFAFINEGQRLRAAANVTVSVLLGLAAVWIGHRLAERWLGV